VLGGSANSARTDGGAAWSVKPVSSTEKWLRVEVEGDSLYGFRVRGTDFTVTGIKSVRASGGPPPSCTVAGGAATLSCDGELPGGISVFVNFTVSGSGGAYDFALLFTPDDSTLFFVPSREGPPPARLGGSFGKTSETTGRVTIRNASKTSFNRLEVEPVGFFIRSVTRFSIGKGNRAQDCAVTEGGGAACQGALGPGQTAVISFRTTPSTEGGEVVLLAHGAQTGFIDVPAGDPCVDLAGLVERLRAEAGALKPQVAQMERELRAAKTALHGAKLAAAEKRVDQATAALGKLSRRLAAVKKEIAAAQQQLRSCEKGTPRKTAAAVPCDAQTLAVARTAGKVRGLAEGLTVERRVAAKAKAAQRLARPRVGKALKHLNALIALPAKTQKTLVSTARAAARAGIALDDCQTSQTQG
jgi:hypothetical protein